MHRNKEVLTSSLEASSISSARDCTFWEMSSWPFCRNRAWSWSLSRLSLSTSWETLEERERREGGLSENGSRKLKWHFNILYTDTCTSTILHHVYMCTTNQGPKLHVHVHAYTTCTCSRMEHTCTCTSLYNYMYVHAHVMHEIKKNTHHIQYMYMYMHDNESLYQHHGGTGPSSTAHNSAHSLTFVSLDTSLSMSDAVMDLLFFSFLTSSHVLCSWEICWSLSTTVWREGDDVMICTHVLYMYMMKTA